jgi:hypothetical protein
VAAARQRADIAQYPIAQIVAGRLHLSAGFVDYGIRRHSIRERDRAVYARQYSTTTQSSSRRSRSYHQAHGER